jgi:hypothetical protein
VLYYPISSLFFYSDLDIASFYYPLIGGGDLPSESPLLRIPFISYIASLLRLSSSLFNSNFEGERFLGEVVGSWIS